MNWVGISLDRAGEEHRHVALHLHYHLLADLFEALGPALDWTETEPHEHEILSAAAKNLDKALGGKPRTKSN